jgi:hypothetical protein
MCRSVASSVARSYWETGGVRYKTTSSPGKAGCPTCGTAHRHRVERRPAYGAAGRTGP